MTGVACVWLEPRCTEAGQCKYRPVVECGFTSISHPDEETFGRAIGRAVYPGGEMAWSCQCLGSVGTLFSEDL